MPSTQKIDNQAEIEDALKRAKCKKVLYLYNESGDKHLLGVFSPKKASQIRKYLRTKKLSGRLSEFNVKTTEPDSIFNYS